MPPSSISISFPETHMSEARDCVVKLVDDNGVEHIVRVRAESVYEAALRGLQKLERVGWDSSGEQIGLGYGRSLGGTNSASGSRRENARMDNIKRKNAAR